MVAKECNLRVGVYKVQTLGTTQLIRVREKRKERPWKARVMIYSMVFFDSTPWH
jgi:hypothetical protein